MDNIEITQEDLNEARRSGFGDYLKDQGFEEDRVSAALPVYDQQCETRVNRLQNIGESIIKETGE